MCDDNNIFNFLFVWYIKHKNKYINNMELTRPLRTIKYQQFVHPALLFVQFNFSLWHVLGKIALNEGINGILFAFYREVLSCGFMVTLAHYNGGLFSIDKEDYIKIFGMGVCCFGNVIGTIVALSYISPFNQAILQPAIPVWTTLLSILLGLEQLTKYKSLGILLSVIGAILLEYFTALHNDSDSEHVSKDDLIFGNTILVLQTISMSCLVTIQKYVIHKYPSTRITAWYYMVAMCLTGLLVPISSSHITVYDLELTGKYISWVALGYAVFFATVFNYNIYGWANKILDPSSILVYSTIQPCFTAVLSIGMLGTTIKYQEVLCSGLVILGLLVLVYDKKKNNERIKNKSLIESLFQNEMDES